MNSLTLSPSTIVFIETEESPSTPVKLSESYLSNQDYEIEEITSKRIYFKSLQNRAARGFVLRKQLNLNYETHKSDNLTKRPKHDTAKLPH